MIDAALRAGLAVFDEAALVTLANAGLYRRAARDVAEGKVALIEAEGAGVVVEADGQRVSIDVRGPKSASCSCKAPGVCRHRLAAVLLVQAMAPDADARKDAGPGAPQDPQGILDKMQPAAIERWAGKAAWRAALELADATATVTTEDNAIVVAFAEPPEFVRILRGQGFDGIVSKVQGNRRKPMHAAALIVARRHFGLHEPESRPPAENGEEAVLPDPAFLDQIDAVLLECVARAFNFAPEPLEERLFMLSVSSRADALPRLGRLLRALAAQLRLKRQRSFTFDPDLCLETLATTHALVRALRAIEPATDADHARQLTGVHRQSYDAEPMLALVGCGVESWRTDSGARGVTGIFYQLARDRWLTYSHARGPGQDPLFDPAQAYAHAAIWGGSTLQKLCGASFSLDAAGVSSEQRLSNPSEAHARTGPATLASRASWPAWIDDWGALGVRLSRRSGLGLTRRTLPDYALLAPRRLAQPYFDDLAQELVWPVEDSNGAWLGLSLPHDQYTSQTAERIERLAQQQWRGDILVQARSAGQRVELSPVSIMENHRPLNLALDAIVKVSGLDQGWLRWGAARRQRPEGFRRAPAGATSAALASIWQRLIDLAEAGEHAQRAQVDGLRAAAEQLDRFGAPALAGRIRRAADGTNHDFLAASYALLLARRQRPSMPYLTWIR